MDNTRQLKSHDGSENHDLVLQSRQAQSLSVHQDLVPPRAETDDFAVVMQFVRLLWKRKWVLVFTCVIGAIVATERTLSETPQYVSVTSLEIENVQEPFGSRLVASSPGLQTQIQLLYSQNLRTRASSKLNNKPPSRPPKAIVPLERLRKMLGMKQPIESVPWKIAVGLASGTAKI